MNNKAVEVACRRQGEHLLQEDEAWQETAAIGSLPGIATQLEHRFRSYFRKKSQQGIMRQWIEMYDSAGKLLDAQIALDRKKREYINLDAALDAEDRVAASLIQLRLSKLEADKAEENHRRDRVGQNSRLNSDLSHSSDDGPEPPENLSEDEVKLKAAWERRQLDARWEMYESLKSFNSLIELQRWRREQRDRILRDRTVKPRQQAENLELIDDFYERRRAELRGDARIFEGD